MTDRINYWDYIKLDELHRLQSNTQTDKYDEVMFIAIHQHFELWFFQIIRNLDEVIRRLQASPPEVVAATALMNRVNQEFICATQGFEVMKTLSRESFLSFRDALRGASGLQSAQLTIIELLTGRHGDEMYHELVSGSGMQDFLAKYRGPDGILTRIAQERLGKGTLRTAYDHVASYPDIKLEELEPLKAEIARFDEQLFGWRKLHYEAAATVLGPEFTSTSGTVGNQHSCSENLKTGMEHTRRYFDDLAHSAKS